MNCVGETGCRRASAPIRVRVSREGGAVSAYLDDVDLSFKVPGNDGQAPVSCWSLWIVVG